jgi:hypothetical protein
MNIDLASTLSSPVAMTLDTTIYDTAISRALPAATGVGAESLNFLFSYDTTSVVVVTAGDAADLSDGVAVTADWLTGSPLSGYAGAGVGVIGYVGPWRYVKINITNPVANTSVYAFGNFLSKAPEAA